MQPEPDLTLTLLEHRAMRVDSTRLVRYAHDMTQADARRQAEHARTWYTGFAGTIHDHHRVETEIVFPALVARQPAFGAIDDELEDEHTVLEDRVAAGSGALLRLGGMAESPGWTNAKHDVVDAMRALADIVHRHLDHEERTAFVLLRDVMSEREFARVKARAWRVTGVRPIPFAAPWALEKAGADEAREILGALPRPFSWLYERRWRPRYARLVAAAGLPLALRSETVSP